MLNFWRNRRADEAVEASPHPAVGAPNAYWARHMQTNQIVVAPKAMLRRSDTFFTIGSCFALEIRRALKEQGLAVEPDYRQLAFDRERVKIGKLPESYNNNFYNTFSIRQELDRAAGNWTQDPEDVWEIPGRVLRDGEVVRGLGSVYEDPYRRTVYGTTREDLAGATKELNRVVSEGMRRASVFIITLGLTEVFVKTDNGMVANQEPKGDKATRNSNVRFHSSTYAENLANVERTIGLIHEINPRAQIVISVSPVPLARTYTGDDIYVANLRSKSTLLAVARDVCERMQCHYFPAYEIVSNAGRQAFQEDGRHVRPSVVKTIVELFIESTFLNHPGRTEEKAATVAA
jgi:hypothetical protein